eukprot:g5421.t1
MYIRDFLQLRVRSHQAENGEKTYVQLVQNRAFDGVQRRPRSLLPLGDSAIADFRARYEARDYDLVAFVNRESGGQTGVAVFKQLVNLLGGENVVNLAQAEEPGATLAELDFFLSARTTSRSRAKMGTAVAERRMERVVEKLGNEENTQNHVDMNEWVLGSPDVPIAIAPMVRSTPPPNVKRNRSKSTDLSATAPSPPPLDLVSVEGGGAGDEDDDAISISTASSVDVFSTGERTPDHLLSRAGSSFANSHDFTHSEYVMGIGIGAPKSPPGVEGVGQQSAAPSSSSSPTPSSGKVMPSAELCVGRVLGGSAEERRSKVHDVEQERARPVRFLVCGGDGTATWILNEMSRFPQLQRQVPVAICPLGTGNDLARSLGWGKGLQRVQDLANFIDRAMLADVVALDRWRLEIQPDDLLPNDHCFFDANNCLPKEVEEEEVVLEERTNGNKGNGNYNNIGNGGRTSTSPTLSTSSTTAPPASEVDAAAVEVLEEDEDHGPPVMHPPIFRGYFHSYFSIGMDAELSFHVERSRRESKVGKKCFRLGLGKCCYGWQGFARVGCFAKQFCFNSTLLSKDVEILQPSGLSPLQSRKIQDCLASGRCRQLTLLNINSYGSGSTAVAPESQHPADGRLELCAVRNQLMAGPDASFSEYQRGPQKAPKKMHLPLTYLPPGPTIQLFNSLLFFGCKKMHFLEQVHCGGEQVGGGGTGSGAAGGALLLRVKRPVFMQYDGEAWHVPCGSRVKISGAMAAGAGGAKGQGAVLMLRAPREEGFWNRRQKWDFWTPMTARWREPGEDSVSSSTTAENAEARAQL